MRWRARRRRGRVLAVKWGLNPNSSSLGVDVTFLLVGATALSIVTPIVATLVRLRASRAKFPDIPSSPSPSSPPSPPSPPSPQEIDDESLAQPTIA